jgi:hypothetical protein
VLQPSLAKEHIQLGVLPCAVLRYTLLRICTDASVQRSDVAWLLQRSLRVKCSMFGEPGA